MTTASLVVLWAMGTLFARPLSPILAGMANSVEMALDLDISLGERDS